MSAAGILFGLLGQAQGGTVWKPPTSPSTPPPGTGSSLLPAPYDETVAKIRPTIPVLDTYMVGADKKFTRIADAVEQGAHVQAAAGGGHINIVADPGTYDKEPAHIQFKNMSLFSASGKPNSVKLFSGFDSGIANFYMEGVFMDSRVNADSKYGIHGAVENGWAILAGSTLTYSGSDIGSGWPMGTDGGDNGYYLLYDTELIAGSSDGRTNNHHAIGTATAPFKMLYVNVRSNGGLEFNGMDQGQPDELWVIDSTAAWAGLRGSAGKAYISGGTLGVAPGAMSTAPVVTDRRDWPLPDWSLKGVSG